MVFDARGNGGGDIAPTITGDHQNRITDYTAIVVEVRDEDTDDSERSRGGVLLNGITKNSLRR